MLYGRHMLPTIPASDLARARAWYADKLGFTTTGQEEAAALLYRSGEDRQFLLFSPLAPGPPSISSRPGSSRICRRRSRSCVPGGLNSRSTTSLAFARWMALRSPPSERRPGSKTAKATYSLSLSSVTALEGLKDQGLVSRAVGFEG
jgi:hypothetical protein